MYRVGRTTAYHFDVSDKGFAALRESGMTLVEHSLAQDVYYDPREVVKLANNNDVKVWTCHLPFKPFDVLDASTLCKDTRQKVLARYTEEIKKSASVGIDKFVMHPGTPFEDERERPERLKCAMELVNELAEIAHREGAVIAVEDMPHCIGRSIDEIEALVNTNPKLRVCFDVNHLLHDSHSDFIDRLGSRIVTVHFSDYDFIEERHQFPTEGKISWVPLITKLYASGYTGPWIYECALEDKTHKIFYDTAARILKEAGVPEIV